MIMRVKERRGRETLSSLSSLSSRKKERERERECNTCAGKITSDCNGTRVASKDDERRSSESKRNRGKEEERYY